MITTSFQEQARRWRITALDCHNRAVIAEQKCRNWRILCGVSLVMNWILAIIIMGA
jgi:hypothetical protein